MKCPKCDGSGEMQICEMGFIGKDECDKCHGKGYLTNEEWFDGLSTEEKAKWLYDHYVNARADEYYDRQEKTLSEYQKWLVSVHREIDGTKID